MCRWTWGTAWRKNFVVLGANLLVTPEADSLPLEIGGVDYRPVNAGAYLPEADLGKLKTIFWRFNIIGFAPILEYPVSVGHPGFEESVATFPATEERLCSEPGRSIPFAIPDGTTYVSGIEKTNPWWRVEGSWFAENAENVLWERRLPKKFGCTIGGRSSTS